MRERDKFQQKMQHMTRGDLPHLGPINEKFLGSAENARLNKRRIDAETRLCNFNAKAKGRGGQHTQGVQGSFN